MATENVSKIYGRPKFGLIVGAFVIAILVVLAVAILFLRHYPKPKEQHRTGMVFLLSGATVTKLR